MKAPGIRKYFRSVAIIGVAVIVTALASPPNRTDAGGKLESESLLSESFESNLTPSFNAPGRFRFITPIANNPHDPNANFDADLLPYLTVSVCKVSVEACVIVKSFNSLGSMSTKLRIESKPRDGRYYIVNWDTGGEGLSNTATYRISVDAAGILLGSVDLPPEVYLPLGRTWPIKFIIEKDAELRVRVLSSAGASLWEVADVLRSELGICDDELGQLLLETYPGATAEQVEMVVNGVCQDAIVPMTTKIADTATRTALASFDLNTGLMIYATETSLLKNLKVNDVLVSKPSAAAPYGYLRRITSVRKVNGTYVLETVQASLNEAITRGEVDASGPLEADDGGEAADNSFRTLDAFDEPVPAQFGEGFVFEKSFDETFVFDGSDGDIQGSGEVNVKGFVRFQAGYDIGLGVEACFDQLPPVCVDRFEARLGANQYSKIEIDGEFNGSITKEKVVHTKIFKPIVIFIGPFPIVLVPVVDIVVGLDGQAHVNFRFAAELSEQLVAGAKWTDPGDGGIGWENVSSFNTPQGRVLESNLTFDMQLVGYGKGVAKLLLYGVAGPGFAGRVGMKIKVQTGSKPLWSIYGHLGAEVLFQVNFGGLLNLSEFRRTIVNEDFFLAESANSPPVFSNIRDGAIQARVNRAVFIGPDAGLAGRNYDVVDPEGDVPTLTAAVTPDGTVNWPNVTFPSPGLKTVKITARDSEGLTSDLYLGVDVRNSPPSVTITPPSGAVPATAQYWLTASAYDPEEGTLRCSSLTWTATGSHTKFVSSSTRSCAAVFKFSNAGPHTVTVSATDSLGATIFKEHHVDVLDPPEHPFPEIVPDSFSIQAISRIIRLSDDPTELGCLPGAFCEVENGDLIYNGYGGDFIPPLVMRLNTGDPADIVQWQCQTGENFAPVTDNGDGSYSCTPIYVANEPIRVYAFIFRLPPIGSDSPISAVRSPERIYFMLQAPN
ncbi:MAG TPA: hypothetical protein VMM38_14270 [Aridibacter sp.]|nr:hypothetical protein [Aridibacter sp.]